MKNEHLEHHGIIGQKWGIRRYQNSDGSLTPAGRKRYLGLTEKKERAAKKAERAKRSAEKYANRNYFLRGEDGFARRQMKAIRAQTKYERIAKKIMDEYGDVPLSEVKKQKKKELRGADSRCNSTSK